MSAFGKLCLIEFENTAVVVDTITAVIAPAFAPAQPTTSFNELQTKFK